MLNDCPKSSVPSSLFPIQSCLNERHSCKQTSFPIMELFASRGLALDVALKGLHLIHSKHESQSVKEWTRSLQNFLHFLLIATCHPLKPSALILIVKYNAPFLKNERCGLFCTPNRFLVISTGMNPIKAYPSTAFGVLSFLSLSRV